MVLNKDMELKKENYLNKDVNQYINLNKEIYMALNKDKNQPGFRKEQSLKQEKRTF